MHATDPTSPTPLLLIGAGGHAAACIDVIEAHGGWRVAGLLGSAHEVGQTRLGYEVIGTDGELDALAGRFGHALIAVGQIADPAPRVRLFGRLREAGFVLPVIVSPHACVSRHATLGAGTIVMHGAIVNACANIGDNGIVNTRALIEHDARIGEHCHVSTGAIVNGGARVGARSFIGSGSTVREMRTIGADCVVGMGQRVLSDLDDGTWQPPRRAR